MSTNMEDLLQVAICENLKWNDVEDAFLYDCQKISIIKRKEQYGRLSLEDLTPEEARHYFRFDKEDLQLLARALKIPNPILTKYRHRASDVEGLCIALRPLVYPNRLMDLEPLFGLSAQSLSCIANQVFTIIHENTSHLLSNLRNLQWLNQKKLKQYAQAVATKGAPLENCWGFIDGTARAVCRPSVNQQEYFSGHKRFHCVKYQAVAAPDGIIISLKGPFPGRRHDAGMFRESGFYRELQQCTVFPDGDNYVLYGDQAYGISDRLLCPYGSRNLTERQQLFNNAMKSVRQSVEWAFGKLIQEFAFLDLKKNQKLLLQDITQMYTSATILNNCHTCLYGNQTAKYFQITPPTLEQYLCL